MKKTKRLWFESWKAIPLPALGVKLVVDGLLYYMCIRETLSYTGRMAEWYPGKADYANKFGWFMYVCFGTIILFDVIMLLRVGFASRCKPQRIQPNPQLNLFLKNSRIRAEKFCLTTLIWSVVPFVFMAGYISHIDDDALPTAIIAYAVIYLVIMTTLIKSRRTTSKQKKFSSERLTYLQAAQVEYESFSAELLNENAVIFTNLTGNMISSFSTGNFSPTGTVFYDLDNELMPWLEQVPQFQYDAASRRNHIVVADCEAIENLSEFIAGVYQNFRRSASKYACLTIGLVNAHDISEKDFDLGLAKDFRIVPFSSYKTLELMSLSAGRIPVIREIGTPEENNEAKRIAEETANLAQDANALTEKYTELLRECSDISSERYNGVTQPDYSYALTSLVLDKISSQRMRSIFLSRSSCFYLADPERRLCKELNNIGICTEINPDNEYLYSILKNILFEPSEVKRVMGLFDYIDFMLRTVEIYSYIKQGGEAQAFEIETGFYNLAHRILEYTPKTNRTVRKIISIPSDSHINVIIGTVEVYFNLISATGNIDLCGLCHLIDIVRNKTRGHGSVKEENSAIIQCFLLIAIELLHDFLSIKSFNLYVENNAVFAGYGAEKYDCSKIIYAKDGLPCIPIRMQGENKEYINFFKGKYIVPDFVQAE
ncbi:MAG: hypothetical protein ACI4Q4_01685 [Oscillospiraceae bacterium]